MQVIERFLRWYFNISVSAETYGSDWGFRSDLQYGGLSYVAGAGLLIVLGALIWLYRQEARPLSRFVRLWLLGLRMTTVFCLLVMLVQARLVMVEFGRPLLAILLDTSASMSLTDEYPHEQHRLLQHKISNVDGRPRIDLVRSWLLADEAAWLRSLESRFEIDFSTFDENVTPLASHRGATEGTSRRTSSVLSTDDLSPLLRELEATGARTNLARAVQRTLRTHRGASPVAMVVISDGNPTDVEKGRLSSIAARAREAGSPLFVVGAGSERGSTEVAIERIEFDAIAFAGSPASVDVTTAGRAETRQRQRVTIRAKGASENLDSRTVEVTANTRSVTTSLRIPNLDEGRNDFELRIEPMVDDGSSPHDSRRIRIWGRETQLRVLLIENLPRWEFRHLKTTLERDRFVDLKTFLMQSDVAYTVEDRTAVARLPTTDSEMADYDAIIIGDVNLSDLEPRFVDLLRRFVGETGGGLLWIPGAANRLTDSLPPTLTPLIPVELREVEPPPVDSSFLALRPRQSLDGKGHELMETLASGEDAVAWESLPQVYVESTPLEPREGSLVLLEGISARGQGQERSRPLLTAMRFGAGPVLLQSFDETWRWRPLLNGRMYRQYWSQTVRFLTRQRVLDQLPSLELISDRDDYLADDDVRVRLIANRPLAAVPSPPRLLVVGEDERREFVMTRSEHSPHVREAVLTDLPPGRYSGVLTGGVIESPPAVEWVVQAVDRERTHRGLNRTDLQLAAERSGGKYYNLWDMDRLLDDLPTTQRTARRHLTEIPLWNRWEAFCLVSGLLILEWSIRRRQGLV